MKPDWKDAPEWAKFVSQDDDGKWWWFECRPKWVSSSGEWFPKGDSRIARADSTDRGNGTCEPRP